MLYDQGSGRLFYDADADADRSGAAVQFALLPAGAAPIAADFVVVAPVSDLVAYPTNGTSDPSQRSCPLVPHDDSPATAIV